MSYISPPILNFSLPMVSAGSVTGQMLRGVTGAAASSGVWTIANSARYLPMRIPAGVTVKRLWVWVGATGGTDTWDLGIYTDGGVQIVHMGSTTAGTANTIQFMDITDTYLGPGAYYMAMSSSGTTATVNGWVLTGEMAKIVSLYQTTAHPLPTTATFATTPGTARIPIIGYCTTATP